MKKSYSILILVVQFSVNESVSSGQTIISSGGNFELGFFTPGDSPYYYIGIWYKKLYPQAVVWVANRDKPLDSADANLIISQGNLVLLHRLQNSIWSALTENINPNISVTALVRDDGNLILSDVSKASIGYDKWTQRKQVLVAWKNSSDPAPGMYSLEMDPKNAQYYNRIKIANGLDGLFSIKSDVFSFGVVALEIISGRRNTGFYQSEEALNLLGYVKDPNHRPNMSDVILMLGGEGTNLPTPNRPAFVIRTHASSTSSSSSNKKYIVSNNQVMITVEEGC
ncbi:hypothetical protein H5410_035634 [Solanum commersonii]|uniref:Bulb-type lectin domain-containing protein n=1 Tax=Solanum commersonii TaxID=4109 RepID=A0A9J5Y368_SOLCO|nr:hypothetical protein H5410_035634 [Solanum commersonii]